MPIARGDTRRHGFPTLSIGRAPPGTMIVGSLPSHRSACVSATGPGFEPRASARARIALASASPRSLVASASACARWRIAFASAPAFVPTI